MQKEFSRRSFVGGVLSVAALLKSGLLAGCAGTGKNSFSYWRRQAMGKTLRRLPVNVVPENVFFSLTNNDFQNGETATSALIQMFGRYSPYNVITLTLRAKNDLSNPETFRRVKRCAEQAREYGIDVLMDIDPRIAREEFLTRWPMDAQRIVYLAETKRREGKAVFSATAERLGDHMSSGTRGYEPTQSHVLRVTAFRKTAKGAVDPSSVRKLPESSVHLSTHLPKQVSGHVEGLREEETAVVSVEFELFSCDVFSPHLIPFENEMIRRYSVLPLAGAMRDEWGFPPTNSQMRKFRAFWYSRHYAAAYGDATGGRCLDEDLLLMGFPFSGKEKERSAAVSAYMRLNLRRNAEIENAFYQNDKEIFGENTYVPKHATWWPRIDASEAFHNGLDWWAAKRDWAQSDESTPIPARTGMTKKMGGPCWMNEGYSDQPEHYLRNIWRYALSGGRMVYHPVYGKNSPKKGLSNATWKIRSFALNLTPDTVRAHCRVRLLNLISRAPLDCPAAWIFSHKRFVDWTDRAYADWGMETAMGIWRNGYGTDAYPASEIEEKTFRLDTEGYLCVGKQRYTVAVLYRLSPEEITSFRNQFRGKSIKTKLFFTDMPNIPDATQLPEEKPLDVLLSALAQTGSPRQTPLTEESLLAFGFPRAMPAPNGTARLTDGTIIRISALSSPAGGAGDPLHETLAVGENKITFQAQGLFAVRQGKDGETEAIAAGGLTSLDAPGLSIRLEKPQDIALWKEHGHWHGIRQTFCETDPVPKPLLSITRDWGRLLLPEPLTSDQLANIEADANK